MTNPKIEIFLMCRDRVDYAAASINSIRKQTYKNFQLIVSDNSLSSEFNIEIKKKFPSINIKRRLPPMSAVDHQNIILDEVESDYFIVFHDDDLMFPKYLDSMVEYIKKFPECSAIAPNGLIIKNNIQTRNKFAKQLDSIVIHKDGESIFNHYMNFQKSFHAPFPGYIYKKEFIGDIRYKTSDGGIYNDVAFLMKLANKAPILWAPEPLIYYRDHDSAGRYVVDFKGKLALSRFARQFRKLYTSHEDIVHYKINFYIKYLIISYKNLYRTKRTYRIRILLKLVMGYILKNPKMLFMLINIKIKKIFL